jgi:hypothetical protein
LNSEDKNETRVFQGGSIADNILGLNYAKFDPETKFSLDESLRDWIEMNGTVEWRVPQSPPGVLVFMIGSWHISLSRLRWEMLEILPVLIRSAMNDQSIRATAIEKLLGAVESVMSKLSSEELSVLLRIQDQDMCFEGSSLELLQVGMNEADRELIRDITNRLIGAKFLKVSNSKRLSVVI